MNLEEHDARAATQVAGLDGVLASRTGRDPPPSFTAGEDPAPARMPG